MNSFVYLCAFIPLIGTLTLAEDNDDAPYLALMQQVRALKTKVKDISLRLREAEKTKIILAERLDVTLKKIAEIESKKGGHEVTRRAYTDSQVAFFASLRHSLRAIPVHDTIIFDDEITTTSTDIYNSANGMFTAPVTGMYVFSWTQNVDHQDYQSTELVVDGKPLAWAYADTAGDEKEDDYGSSSQTVVVMVHKGKHVFVRTGAQGKGTIHGEDYSTFSGFLLFKVAEDTDADTR